MLARVLGGAVFATALSIVGYSFTSQSLANCQCRFSDKSTQDCFLLAPGQSCSAACAGLETNRRRTERAIAGRGACPVTIQPGTYETLKAHALASMRQFGAVVWEGPNGDVLARGERLREILKSVLTDTMKTQAQALNELTTAELRQLENATVEAIEICKTTGHGTTIREHFRYVLRYDKENINNQYSRKDFLEIRNIFSRRQEDPNIKNVIKCFSGPELLDIARQELGR